MSEVADNVDPVAGEMGGGAGTSAVGEWSLSRMSDFEAWWQGLGKDYWGNPKDAARAAWEARGGEMTDAMHPKYPDPTWDPPNSPEQPKLFRQAEVDALIAAAYEDVAKLMEKFWSGLTYRECLTQIRSRTPADAQKALAEHDAALRAELLSGWCERCAEEKSHSVMSIPTGFAGESEPLCAECISTMINDGDDKIEKLEAENAELRRLLKHIRDWHECDCECNDENCCDRVGQFCPHCVANRALLAKSGGKGNE